ncbi:hypothetical protein CRD59_07115 [Bifidobacterium xylocopae]|uniref:DUF8175 domain-containing protein n=2 Tax=Bifidobacterium xylocopae TaxID=2493119 RepID=A0A366KAT9_9BIFI|nr:hypothetical protein CRD59_07115 [Bifidobacterium xylocopae]
MWPWPSSSAYGPGRAPASGVRSCFAHSPEGALFAAANIAAMWTDPAIMGDADKVSSLFGKGPAYDEIVSRLHSQGLRSGRQAQDVRASMQGFRLLEYAADHASVDLGYEGSQASHSSDMSMVYMLVWSDGDWKLRSESAPPMTSAAIPSMSGYVEWRER